MFKLKKICGVFLKWKHLYLSAKQLERKKQILFLVTSKILKRRPIFCRVEKTSVHGGRGGGSCLLVSQKNLYKSPLQQFLVKRKGWINFTVGQKQQISKKRLCLVTCCLKAFICSGIT